MPAHTKSLGDATDELLSAEEQLRHPGLRILRVATGANTTRVVYYILPEGWAGASRPAAVPEEATRFSKRPSLEVLDAAKRSRPRPTQSPSGTVTEVQSGAQLRDWDCSPSLKGGTARDCELSANRFKRTVRDCGRSTLRVQGTGTEHRGRKQDCRALRDCKHNPV